MGAIQSIPVTPTQIYINESNLKYYGALAAIYSNKGNILPMMANYLD